MCEIGKHYEKAPYKGISHMCFGIICDILLLCTDSSARCFL
ncbi:hypothetical protein CLOSTHATH_00469 [Hungatella hathewayi DSM 13479]|uniref:Uncharacterized protein n=1 Tax=Hungatella hathewayi DSM 13479 TaxID=566550 RepID=D3AA48_9FIRM|nr:hypothetical protein CLOSTHATH_00469 [Hungatella hathewayi DSM 13479]